MPSRSLFFLLPGDPDTRTGGYGYDREIIAGLRALGWQVEVRLLDAGFPYPSGAALEAARMTMAAIPDAALVIVDGLAFGAMPEIAEAEARRLRLVGLVHHPLALETGLDAQQILAFREAERRALATTRGVIVTSDATRRTLADYAVPSQRVTVIEPGTAAAPVAAGSGAAALMMLCVASLSPRKGHDVLFAALSGLKDHAWHLTCIGGAVGDDTILSRLRAGLDESGIADRVRFAGEGDDAVVSAAYSAADLFVLPTRYEGYGMVVAEALARGLPVVSTATGAIPELVGERAGIVVPPGDTDALQAALRSVLEQPSRLKSLRRGALAARERLPRWQDSVRKLSAVLEGMLQS